MEKLVIHVPEAKSALVKALLKELGVAIEWNPMEKEAYLKKITEMPAWSEEDVTAFEEAIKTMNGLTTVQ